MTAAEGVGTDDGFEIGRGGAPPLPLLLLEPQRAFLEAMALPLAGPWLARAPRGDGHPVLVLPGYMAGDRSTSVLRRFLCERGFAAYPWRLGRNLGPSRERFSELEARLAGVHAGAGRKVSLVGWSLGGVFARELARRAPGKVRCVVSLGSPFGDVSRASNVSRFWRRSESDPASPDGLRAVAARLRPPPGVPSTAIYSRSDGVVHWRACREPQSALTENIEISGSHCGLGLNALALYAVADRLGQAEGAWQPFDRTGWRARIFT